MRVARGSSYGTRDAGRSWYQYFRDRLPDKFRVHGRALAKGLHCHESYGRLSFITVSHVDDVFYACDTRCETTKALLDAFVKEFNMSRKQDDFAFICGRRVRVTSEALFISQEFAASSLLPMESCGPQRSAETVLTRTEHREYRSLLVKLQWFQLHNAPVSSPQCSCSQGSVGNHLKVSTRSERCVHGPVGDMWRCLFCQHGRFEESVRCHRISYS